MPLVTYDNDDDDDDGDDDGGDDDGGDDGGDDDHVYLLCKCYKIAVCQ